jgi:thiol-disulfide isomerase/thioredoxin
MMATTVLYAAAATAAPLESHGQAAEFTGIEKWLNAEPLSMQQLRGEVVLVDFWTYTRINSIHTLPYVKSWHAKYKDQGLVVIGVHTPEFAMKVSEPFMGSVFQITGISKSPSRLDVT